MKRALLLSFFLGGCGIFPSAADYHPVIPEITDKAQFLKDMAFCHGVADPYKPGLQTSQIAQATVEGATSNAAYGVINPLVPAAGAAGGAATATIAGLGITGQAGIKILVKCLAKRADRDHAFLIADPNE